MFSLLFCGQTLPSSKGLPCAGSVSGALWRRVAIAREQMTGPQAVCPLLGNKAWILLTQCDN